MDIKKPINIQIGERIQHFRKRAGYTQETFAELINVTSQYVSDVERGKSGVSVETLKRVCEVLSIASDDLLFNKQEMNDILPVIERLKFIPPEYFYNLEIIINKYLDTILIKEKQSTSLFSKTTPSEKNKC